MAGSPVRGSDITARQGLGHARIEDGEGVLIPLRLSQGDLGKLVGLTRETVNSILQVRREQGIVEIDRRRIRLRDPERLKRAR